MSNNKVFTDVLIRTGTQKQPDLTILSYQFIGIDVKDETQNYSGWIHGNEKSEYWIQSIYNEKAKFRNPIKQNWAHIYALKEVLGFFNG